MGKKSTDKALNKHVGSTGGIQDTSLPTGCNRELLMQQALEAIRNNLDFLKELTDEANRQMDRTTFNAPQK